MLRISMDTPTFIHSTVAGGITHLFCMTRGLKETRAATNADITATLSHAYCTQMKMRDEQRPTHAKILPQLNQTSAICSWR